DPATRGVLVLDDGELTWPAPLPPAPAASAQPAKAAAPTEATPVDYKQLYMRSALKTTGMSGLVLGLGIASPNPAFSSMLTTFALSGVV
ncbi:unnamed protein product, partial [Phaeothamnion confervicola]